MSYEARVTKTMARGHTSSDVRVVVAQIAAEADATIAQLLEALELIASTDPVNAALDPQRAIRIARVSIKAAKGEA